MTDHSSVGALLDQDAVDPAQLSGVIAAVVVLALLLVVALPGGLQGAGKPSSGTIDRPITSNGAPASTVALLPSAHLDALEVARRYLGVPYVFGGTNPSIGLDCSGLVQLVYRQLGVAVPRTAQQQFNATTRIPDDQLRPGDLVFFARTYDDPSDWVTHVGIYAGGGQQINAPTTGQVVSIQPVFSGFWGAHYVGAGRVRGLAPTALFATGGSF
jgi:cell wall-associated NlpC family hydrolase